ncbi:MAG: NAD-dependent dehydratase, partial [Flammeovirgaceae bacterium]
MNYVITGSVGHISKPIVQQLIAAGHHASVITSNADRVKDIESLKATALVGSVEDATFVNSA